MQTCLEWAPTRYRRPLGLSRTPAINISRWMKGYSYRRRGEVYTSPPLWQIQWPTSDDGSIEIGFRDLIELRFVKVFTEAGVGLLGDPQLPEFRS